MPMTVTGSQCSRAGAGLEKRESAVRRRRLSRAASALGALDRLFYDTQDGVGLVDHNIAAPHQNSTAFAATPRPSLLSNRERGVSSRTMD